VAHISNTDSRAAWIQGSGRLNLWSSLQPRDPAALTGPIGQIEQGKAEKAGPSSSIQVKGYWKHTENPFMLIFRPSFLNGCDGCDAAMAIEGYFLHPISLSGSIEDRQPS